METKKKKKAENYIKEIRRKTRRVFSSEQKIQIVMEALRAEMSVAELCRKYAINEGQFYKWNKEFLEAGKKRLSGDTTREATSDEVAELRKENQKLKLMVADLALRYDIGKKKFEHAGGSVKFKKYMRFTASEKEEIIQLVTRSEIGVNKTLREIGLNKSRFYNWYKIYSDQGVDGLNPSKRSSNSQWNSIPQEQKNLVVELALEYPHLSSRELSCKLTDEQQIFISESSVYRILKSRGLIATPAHIFMSASDEFSQKTRFVHEMWQTDFTYFKILGWGWYYLSTVLDDFSRYIVHWEICEGMKVQDVKRTIDRAIVKAKNVTKQRPKLLSDNGSCYIASELKSYLKDFHDMAQVHGRPQHPQTQGKIERYHRTMKNVVKLDHYYCVEELEVALEIFVENYNNQRYHESLQNLTPADVYFGRGEKILNERNRIKRNAFLNRKSAYENFKNRKNKKNELVLN
ncbi:MAG: IS3 family transposase [Crocinitomicaceae bacterium]|nr:IS3 family transposase [Crocinitomicaceae bacterium]